MRKFILLLLVALLLPLLISCQVFAEDECLDFTLPAWPDYLPKLEGWKVTVYSPGREAVEDFYEVGPGAKKMALRLDKNIPCGISVKPLTQNRFFKPAGTIYPYSRKITWSGGYAAHLYKIIPQSTNFNWERLLEALENSDPSYNPWLLDSQQLLQAIAWHNFNANKLKLSNVLIIPLDFDVFCSYVPENQAFRRNKSLSVIKGKPQLFALENFGLIISASSAKNISLDFISMPIFKEEL